MKFLWGGPGWRGEGEKGLSATPAYQWRLPPYMVNRLMAACIFSEMLSSVSEVELSSCEA